MVTTISIYKLAYTALVVSSLSLVLFSSPVLAQNNSATNILQVSPAVLKLTLSPGKTEHYTIKVTNLTDAPLPTHITVEGFDADDEDTGIGSLPVTTPSPLVEWIKSDKDDSIIPGKQSDEVHLTITIPEKVNIGAYSAMIFFNPVPQNSSPLVKAKIGVLALANIGVPETENKVSVPTFDFGKWLYDHNPVKVTARIQNNSLNYFSAKTTLTIKPLFGPLQSFDLGEKIIFPGKVRRFSQDLNLQNTTSGIYIAKLTIGTGDGHPYSTTTQFYLFPYQQSLVLLAVVGILLTMIIWRRRIVKAAKILAGKK